MTREEVLVTGASGFVGRAVVDRLLRDGVGVRAAVRKRVPGLFQGARLLEGLDLIGGDGWADALNGVSSIVHCAARVHVTRDRATDPLAEFRRVNVEGTVSLAILAAAAGVKRLVFVSSIGVNGAETSGQAFMADDVPAPHSPYAVSKLEAELALHEMSARCGIEIAVVRPPLVYGPDAPGNFGALFKAVARGVPMPLGAVHNLRSLVALDNLVDLLLLCTRHSAAAGKTFLASDGADVSTTVLLRQMASALGCHARLLPVPVSVLRGAGRFLGLGAAAQSLCGSLQVDIAKTEQLLGWRPALNMEAALAECACAYRAGAA
jgi:nucleoside-diphosphate-sugar epimerase